MRESFDYKKMKYEEVNTEPGSENKNSIAYFRVSTNKQKYDGHGIEGQEGACLQAQATEGFVLKKDFRDEAMSGKIKNRPGLQQALEYVKEQNKVAGPHNIKYLLCSEISRLSRPEFLDEGLELMVKFLAEGITVYDVFSKEYYERSNDMKMIQLMFKLYSAKDEREQGSKRAVNGMRERLRCGYRSFSSPPAGYEYVHETVAGKTNAYVVKKEPYATIIGNALKMYAEGHLYNAFEFLTYLKDHNFQTNSATTKGNNIHRSLFRRLTEPHKLCFYAGLIIYPKWGIFEAIPAKHEAVIDQETLNKVFQRLDKAFERRPLQTTNNYREKFPLKRILRCKCCKKLMYGSYSGGNGGKYGYYECKNKLCDLRGLNISRSCKAEDIHSDMRNLLIQYETTTELNTLIKEILGDVLSNKKNVLEGVIKSKKKALASASNEAEKLQSAFVSAKEPALAESIEARRKAVKDNVLCLEHEVFNLENSRNLYEPCEGVIKILENPLKIRDNGDTDTKQLLLKILFDGEIYYQKNEGLRTSSSAFPMRLLNNSGDNSFCNWACRDSNPGPVA